MNNLFKNIVLFLVMSVSLLAAKGDYFVTAQWLKDNIEKENLLILDARGKKSDFMKGHIPGAVLTSWPAFSKMDGNASTNKEWGVLKDRSDLEKSLQSVGLNNDSEVIVYTDSLNGFGEGARLLWMLKYAGFDNVKLLDGGIASWKNAEGKTANFGKRVAPGNYTIKNFNKKLVISTKSLNSNLKSYSILDTREAAEYNGEKNYGESKNGRIPGSKNIFYKDFLDEEGKLKSKKEVDFLIAESGLDTSKTIIPYCTGGIRSSMGWLAMMTYGYDAANYDSSFAGWTLAGMPLEN